MSTPEDRLRQNGDTIIAGILGSSEVNVERRKRILSGYSPNLFRNEHYAIYRVLWSFRNRDVVLNEDLLTLHLLNNRKILDQKYSWLNLDDYPDIEDDPILGYINGVGKYFTRLLGETSISDVAFDQALELYVSDFEMISTLDLLSDTSKILVDGDGKRQGFSDAGNHVKSGLAQIEGLVERNVGAGFVSIEDAILNQDTVVEKSEMVCTWGDIDELNEAYKGIYTGNLYTVLAPPKAGKSKFGARCIYNAIKAGQNCVVWPVEGGIEYFTAQMRAIHFDEKVNEGITDPLSRITGVSQATILHDTFESEKIKEMERSTAIDLATGGYGKILFIDRPFEVDTFINEIDTAVESIGATFVFVDYMQLIGAGGTRLDKRERLEKAYPELLTYCKKANVAVMSPAQYTQEAIKSISKNKDGDDELRTAGGGSAEIIRSSDYVLAMWSSTEDLKNRRITFKSVPTRFHMPFNDFTVYADLGTCQFISEKV